MSLGVYIHVPFCGARCAYCDFAIVTGQDARMPAYVDALCEELRRWRSVRGRRAADTVHLGGGTPSRLPPVAVARVLGAVRETFDVVAGAEIGLEANPEDVTDSSVAGWLEAGVTRVSVGVQSLDPRGLPALGRPGDVLDARRALAVAAAAGVPSLGADLIFGWPGQETADWASELEDVVRLPVQHLSLYALETDAPTPLVRAIERGAVPRTDPDTAAAMYDAALPALAAAGFERYEISNFAHPGQASRHNRKYWEDEPYAGFGQAAAAYVDGERWTNPRRYSDYMGMIAGTVAPPPVEPYDPDRRAGEALVFGLRLDSGVDLERLAARHGAEPLARRAAVLEGAVRQGWLLREGPRVRLAPEAVLVAHEIFVDLL